MQDDVRENGKIPFFKKESMLKMIVLAGLAGIVLIFCSSMFRKDTAKEDTFAEVSQSETDTVSQYRQDLCDELGNMLASIEGVGKTKIMLTLDGTVRNIYATDNDIQQRETSQKNSSNENADKQSTEKQSCIVIRQNDGSEKALTVGQLMPKIKGVLVVCEGGNDPEICTRVSEAVSAALDVTSSHICVTKMNT